MDYFCAYAEKETGLIINLITILRQSAIGINGAKEALLDWHQDTKIPIVRI